MYKVNYSNLNFISKIPDINNTKSNISQNKSPIKLIIKKNDTSFTKLIEEEEDEIVDINYIEKKPKEDKNNNMEENVKDFEHIEGQLSYNSHHSFYMQKHSNSCLNLKTNRVLNKSAFLGKKRINFVKNFPLSSIKNTNCNNYVINNNMTNKINFSPPVWTDYFQKMKNRFFLFINRRECKILTEPTNSIENELDKVLYKSNNNFKSTEDIDTTQIIGNKQTFQDEKRESNTNIHFSEYFSDLEYDKQKTNSHSCFKKVDDYNKVYYLIDANKNPKTNKESKLKCSNETNVVQNYSLNAEAYLDINLVPQFFICHNLDEKNNHSKNIEKDFCGRLKVFFPNSLSVNILKNAFSEDHYTARVFFRDHLIRDLDKERFGSKKIFNCYYQRLIITNLNGIFFIFTELNKKKKFYYHFQNKKYVN